MFREGTVEFKVSADETLNLLPCHHVSDKLESQEVDRKKLGLKGTEVN
jgi:hypothetical protein